MTDDRKAALPEETRSARLQLPGEVTATRHRNTIPRRPHEVKDHMTQKQKKAASYMTQKQKKAASYMILILLGGILGGMSGGQLGATHLPEPPEDEK